MICFGYMLLDLGFACCSCSCSSMLFVYFLSWSMMMSIALGGMFYHAAVPTFVVE